MQKLTKSTTLQRTEMAVKKLKTRLKKAEKKVKKELIRASKVVKKVIQNRGTILKKRTIANEIEEKNTKNIIKPVATVKKSERSRKKNSL